MKSPKGTIRYTTNDDGECERDDARFSVVDHELTIHDATSPGEPPVEVYAAGEWFHVYLAD